jgi:hypothetical protein
MCIQLLAEQLIVSTFRIYQILQEKRVHIDLETRATIATRDQFVTKVTT